MTLIVVMKGTWKLEKGRLVMIDPASKGSKDHLTLDVNPKGDLVELHVLPSVDKIVEAGKRVVRF